MLQFRNCKTLPEQLCIILASADLLLTQNFPAHIPSSHWYLEHQTAATTTNAASCDFRTQSRCLTQRPLFGFIRMSISEGLTNSDVASVMMDSGVPQLVAFASLQEASSIFHTSDSPRWVTHTFSGSLLKLRSRRSRSERSVWALNVFWSNLTGDDWRQVRRQIMTRVHLTVWVNRRETCGAVGWGLLDYSIDFENAHFSKTFFAEDDHTFFFFSPESFCFSVGEIKLYWISALVFNVNSNRTAIIIKCSIELNKSLPHQIISGQTLW